MDPRPSNRHMISLPTPVSVPARSWIRSVLTSYSPDVAHCRVLRCPSSLCVSIHYPIPVRLPSSLACLIYSPGCSPEIFELRDLNDNPDLQRTAMRLLTMVTAITPSFDLLEPLMDSLISILQNAEVGICASFSVLPSEADFVLVVAYQDPLYADPQSGILP